MLTRKQTGDWFDQCDAMFKNVETIAAGVDELCEAGSRHGDDAFRLARQAKLASETTQRLRKHLLKMLHTAGDLNANAIAAGDTERTNP